MMMMMIIIIIVIMMMTWRGGSGVLSLFVVQCRGCVGCKWKLQWKRVPIALLLARTAGFEDTITASYKQNSRVRRF